MHHRWVGFEVILNIEDAQRANAADKEGQDIRWLEASQERVKYGREYNGQSIRDATIASVLVDVTLKIFQLKIYQKCHEI